MLLSVTFRLARAIWSCSIERACSPSPIRPSFLCEGEQPAWKKSRKRQNSAPGGSVKPGEFVLCISPLKHVSQLFSLLPCQHTETEVASSPFRAGKLTKYLGHPPHLININWSFLPLLAGQGAGNLWSRRSGGCRRGSPRACGEGLLLDPEQGAAVDTYAGKPQRREGGEEKREG